MKLHFYLLLLLFLPLKLFAQFESIKKDFRSVISQFIVYKNKLYFSARHGEEKSSQIWIYDSTKETSSDNPRILTNLNTEENSIPGSYFIYNDKLFFNCNNSLYSYDSDLPISKDNPKVITNRGSGYIIYKDKLYYDYNTGSSNPRIWVYDDKQEISNSNPKKLIDNFEINSTSSSLRFYSAVYNDKLYFNGNNSNNSDHELYVYDENLPITNKNPKKISDINSGTNSSSPLDFIVFKNKLYFSADDGTGEELFVYDGINFPKKVYDINKSPYGGRATEKAIYNNNLYFSGTEISIGSELWRYSGESNPQLVIDINPGSKYSLPINLKSYFNKLFFSADNGINGRELFIYDSNLAISNSNPKTFDLYKGSEEGILVESDFIEYNGSLYLSGKTSPINGYEFLKLKPEYLNTINIKESNPITVYPNPVSDILYIDSKTKGNYQISNLVGEIVLSGTYNINGINLSTLTTGVYILKILENNYSVTQKFIKK